VIRSLGSLQSSLLMRSAASFVTVGGMTKTPLLIFWNSRGISSLWNGNEPVSMAYRITPQLHRSTGGPLYGVAVTISGDA
jgi:hypothetical protein